MASAAERDLVEGATIPIAQVSAGSLSPSVAIRGVISVKWPYSAMRRTVAFLLNDPDPLLRREGGQVRIVFRGPVAHMVDETGLGAGDMLLLGLAGAELGRDEESRPGRMGAVDRWQLTFVNKVLMQIVSASTGTEGDPEPDRADANAKKTSFIEFDDPTATADGPAIPPIPVRDDWHGLVKPRPNKRGQDAVDTGEFASPAIVKRARLSYGSFFEGDMFAGDGPSPPRQRLSASGGGGRRWISGSRSPSPEQTARLETPQPPPAPEQTARSETPQPLPAPEQTAQPETTQPLLAPEQASRSETPQPLEQTAQPETPQPLLTPEQTARSETPQPLLAPEQTVQPEMQQPLLAPEPTARSETPQPLPALEHMARSETPQPLPAPEQTAQPETLQPLLAPEQMARSETPQPSPVPEQMARSETPQPPPVPEQMARSETPQPSPVPQQTAGPQTPHSLPAPEQTARPETPQPPPPTGTQTQIPGPSGQQHTLVHSQTSSPMPSVFLPSSVARSPAPPPRTSTPVGFLPVSHPHSELSPGDGVNQGAAELERNASAGQEEPEKGDDQEMGATEEENHTLRTATPGVGHNSPTHAHTPSPDPDNAGPDEHNSGQHREVGSVSDVAISTGRQDQETRSDMGDSGPGSSPAYVADAESESEMESELGSEMESEIEDTDDDGHPVEYGYNHEEEEDQELNSEDGSEYEATETDSEEESESEEISESEEGVDPSTSPRRPVRPSPAPASNKKVPVIILISDDEDEAENEEKPASSRSSGAVSPPRHLAESPAPSPVPGVPEETGPTGEDAINVDEGKVELQIPQCQPGEADPGVVMSAEADPDVVMSAEADPDVVMSAEADPDVVMSAEADPDVVMSVEADLDVVMSEAAEEQPDEQADQQAESEHESGGDMATQSMSEDERAQATQPPVTIEVPIETGEEEMQAEDAAAGVGAPSPEEKAGENGGPDLAKTGAQSPGRTRDIPEGEVENTDGITVAIPTTEQEARQTPPPGRRRLRHGHREGRPETSAGLSAAATDRSSLQPEGVLTRSQRARREQSAPAESSPAPECSPGPESSPSPSPSPSAGLQEAGSPVRKSRTPKRTVRKEAPVADIQTTSPPPPQGAATSFIGFESPPAAATRTGNSKWSLRGYAMQQLSESSGEDRISGIRPAGSTRKPRQRKSTKPRSEATTKSPAPSELMSSPERSQSLEHDIGLRTLPKTSKWAQAQLGAGDDTVTAPVGDATLDASEGEDRPATRARSSSEQMSDGDGGGGSESADMPLPPPPPVQQEVKQPITKLKLQLIKQISSTTLPDYIALKDLRKHPGITVDALAVATATPTSPRRQKGVRDYLLTVAVTDPSVAPTGVVVVQILRPHLHALPVIKAGDVVLFRQFIVHPPGQGLDVVRGQGLDVVRGHGLRAGEQSAWAVFDHAEGGGEHGSDAEGGSRLPQIRGPPVELTEPEEAHAEGLAQWWALLDAKALEKLDKASLKVMGGEVDEGSGSGTGGMETRARNRDGQ